VQLFAAIHLDDIAVILWADLRLSFELTRTKRTCMRLPYAIIDIFGEIRGVTRVETSFGRSLVNATIGIAALGSTDVHR
jgi:hypothetical protein